MIHEVLAVGALRCNCSILGDALSGEAIVVDPGDDISLIWAVLQRHRLQVKQIIITHAHIDHIAGAGRLKALTGAPILYNSRDIELARMMDFQAALLGLPFAPDVPEPDDTLDESRVLTLTATPDSPQTPIAVHILHTPGHTQGSICLYLPDQSLLLAGDTLFAGSIGRTDLPGGDTGTLLRSIHHKLLSLPDSTVVVPGHGPWTTIGHERSTNPFL